MTAAGNDGGFFCAPGKRAGDKKRKTLGPSFLDGGQPPLLGLGVLLDAVELDFNAAVGGEALD